MSNITKVLELLDDATAEDLDTLDRDIRSRALSLEALRRLRSMLAARLGVSSRAAPTVKVKAAGGREPVMLLKHREKLAKYLLHAGPTRPSLLSKACDVPEGGSLSKALLCDYFEKSANGAIQLTAEGRQFANGMGE